MPKSMMKITRRSWPRRRMSRIRIITKLSTPRPVANKRVKVRMVSTFSLVTPEMTNRSRSVSDSERKKTKED